MSERERAVASEILRIARDELRLELPLRASDVLAASLDSLALLSLVVAVEDRFQVILSDDDAAKAQTLDELAVLVAGRARPEVLP